MTRPQPDVHHFVTARVLAHPAQGGTSSVGFAPGHLPRERHPSYAASTCCRFGTLTLRVHGYLQASHNASERALRVAALGRKNFLFVSHDAAGRNLAGLYSLVATCEANGVNPRNYLADVLLRVQYHPASRMDELLPGPWSRRLAADTS